MDERGSVILKGEVYSFVQTILPCPFLSVSLSFQASRSAGSGRSFCRE